MTATECAYRSTHPDVLAHWQRIVDNTWNADIVAAARANGLADVEGLESAVMSWGGRRGFAGFAADQLTLPDRLTGWRITRKGRGRDALVPNRSTKVGKAAHRAIENLGDPPSPASLPGMARDVWVPKDIGHGNYSVQTCGGFMHDGVAYVNWGCPHELVEDPKRTMASGVADLTMWERCKLSEYHTALEALGATR